MKYCILRFGSLYGSRATFNNGLYKLIYDLVHSSSITYVGKSDAQREYIHVSDAAAACIDLLDKKMTIKKLLLLGKISLKLRNNQIISEIFVKNKSKITINHQIIRDIIILRHILLKRILVKNIHYHFI